MMVGLSASPIGPGPGRGRLMGLGLDSGMQSGIAIIGVLAFVWFGITVLGITKSGQKKRA